MVLPGGEPLLRMPFPAGTAAICQQGNRSPRPRSHSWPNTLYALDLAASGLDVVPVVAAAAGEVERVVTEAAAGALRPGGGFGNLVVLRHPGGYQTLYAHLARVDVELGQAVASGQPIGTMGDTGRAGNRHLHFSLHRAERWPDDGAPDSLVIHGLLAVDLTVGGELAAMTSLELSCADSELSPEGHVYGSENARGAAPRFGPLPSHLAADLAVGAERLQAVVEEATAVSTAMKGLSVNGPKATRAALDDHLRLHPDDAVALYWVAVLSLRDLGDWGRAEQAIGRLVELAPTAPAWLVPWVLVRRAQLAEHAGQHDRARELWARAAEIAAGDEELERAVGDAKERLGSPPDAGPSGPR